MARNVFRRLHLSLSPLPPTLSPRQRMETISRRVHCVVLEVKRLETERERESVVTFPPSLPRSGGGYEQRRVIRIEI